MKKATINGAEFRFAENLSILQALKKSGIEVPTLCDDERLKPCGACRLCLVKVKGFSHPIVACENDLTDEVVIETHTPELETARRMNLKMLARKYPREAFKNFPDKPFHRLAEKYGLTENDFSGETNSKKFDASHPYIQVDMSRCVDCYRCVRICDEVQGQFVWQIFGMGNDTQIVWDKGESFAESSCVSCGACVDTCPTGALEDKTVLEKGTPTAWTKTVCPYCGTGCEMNVGTRGEKLVQIKPAKESTVNRGHLCVKGNYAFGFVHSRDRVTEPLIRENGAWKIVGWREAFDFTANKLKEIIEKSGADSTAVLGSARATNEENYLAQKFARVCLATNNVDNCARVCHTPSAAALKMMLGAGAATNSFDDIEFAKTILVCGANPTENHPILGSRIKQAVLRNKTNLIVIDPRKIELAKYADVHLQLKPGTNIALLNSIACAIIEENSVDADFIETRVEDYAKFRDFVRDFSPEKVAGICEVEAADIRRAARIYANEKPSMCVHGLGATEHTQGTEGVMCLINLALITGNLGKRGTGVNPLRGQNNVQGAGHMGCDPGILAGSAPIEKGRERFEKIWHAAIPTSKGLNLMQMMDAAKDGNLKALWAIGYDVFLTLPNAAETADALGNLELLIVQDMFLNETAREFADVFLPAASSFEKDGTFMNGERRVSRVRKVITPVGNSKSDWEIICGVAEAFGKADFLNFRSAEEIWNEVRAVWKESYGITYERIETNGGLQWNCPDESHPGTEVLHTENFGDQKRAALRSIKYIPSGETTDADFPFLLNTGRTLYQFNAGTMTARTKNIELLPTDFLHISPCDAEKLEILNDEIVKVKSKFGEIELPVKIKDSVKPGELFATFHDPRVFLNRLTSSRRDRFVQTPEYKVTAVRVEKIKTD